MSLNLDTSHVEAKWFDLPPGKVDQDLLIKKISGLEQIIVDMKNMLYESDRKVNEQKSELENKLLTARNEIITLRHEILGLKGKFFQLTEEFHTYKPVIDERKRNQLIRRNVPFAFYAESKTETRADS